MLYKRGNVIDQIWLIKKGKIKIFTVPIEIYNYIRLYCYENNISSTSEIFPIGKKAVQKQLKIVCDYLNLTNISTHSFRKYFVTQIYVNNNYGIMLIAWTEFLKDPESERVRTLEMTIDEIRTARKKLIKISSDDKQRELFNMRKKLCQTKVMLYIMQS